MKQQKKNRIRQLWGPAVLAVFLLCLIAIHLCKAILGLSLRSVPQIVLIWLGFFAISAFLAWACIRIRGFDAENKPDWIMKLAGYVLPTTIACIISMSVIALAISVLSYHPEHVAQRNSVRLIARVNRFLEREVNYYQYKGALFYGKEMGYEYYGLGVGDPLAKVPSPEPEQWIFYNEEGSVIESGPAEEPTTPEEPAPTETKPGKIQLDIETITNRQNELVFSISIEDFIDSYNSFYRKDKDALYLSPKDQWRALTYDTAIHSEYETTCYKFSVNEKVWSQPTVTVYVPVNADYIQEVTIDFDDHGYSESFYKAYEEQCFYALKVFFPDMEDEQIAELCTTLNELAFENIFPNEEGYSSDPVPCALFYRDGIGCYPYFAVGEWRHICIIPVTEETIKAYADKGVEIYEME